MSYIGDSVIGSDTAFGGGAITGNFRLDEGEIYSMVDDTRVGTGRTKFGCIVGDHSRLGIRTSFAPGVKIGPQTFVNSALTITSDIPDHSFVTTGKSGRVEIRPNGRCPPNTSSRAMIR